MSRSWAGGGQRVEGRTGSHVQGRKRACTKLTDERKPGICKGLHEARYGWCTEDGSTMPSSDALDETDRSLWHNSRGPTHPATKVPLFT